MIGTFVIILGILVILALYWQRKITIRANLLADELIKNADLKAKKILESAHQEIKALDAKKSAYAKEEELLLEKLKEQKAIQKKLREDELYCEKLHDELRLRQKAIEEREQKTVDELTHAAKREVEERLAKIYSSKRKEIEERIDEESHKLIVQSLARLPSKALHDATIEEIRLPSEEMKSKIIGREGKNIKAFQLRTGVNVVVDETPETIFLSCFDLYRREIAKIALLQLIESAKINPQRIDEEVQAAQNNIEQACIGYGKQAAESLAIYNLHPIIHFHLGKLKLQSSYGQNLLEHSIEVARIIGQIAAEMQLNVSLAMRMGLLHDIGKAIQSEIPSSHALAGYNLLLECGESEEVANGVGCHHNEMAPRSLEAELVRPADFLSGGKKNARMETQELFHSRLKEFEAKASALPGVVSAYAVSGGRELHLFVKPDVVSEDTASRLAKELALELQPLAPNMRVQVSVFRETKVIEYSH